jgi:mannose-1-phosphate guanylyltransferase
MGGERSSGRMKEYYDSVESISIDHGVMEKSTGSLGVLAASFQWNDIGSWSAVDDIWESDDDGNRKSGCEIVSIASQSNTCYSKKLVALLGVENLIIVETDDALLICNKSRAQEIKYLVDEIDRLGYKEYL